jgi:hypothetical protein
VTDSGSDGVREAGDLDVVLPILTLGLLRFAASLLVLGAGLVVAAGAFFTGPSAAVARVRGWFTSGLGSIRRRGEAADAGTGPAGRWTYTHRAALRIGAAALAALAFVFWGHPTATVVMVIAVLLPVVLGLIELTGQPPTQPGPAPHASGG